MKFIDVLFCDDIRLELNNKVSIMGLYNDRIVFRSSDKSKLEWPIKMDLSMLVRFSLRKNDKHPINFIFECFSNENSIVKIDGTTDLATCVGSVFSLVLKTKNINLELGDLGYLFKIYDKDNEYLSKVNKNALTVLAE
ncbi:MAG: hypothetical protein V4501_02060 [Pseudomonadota bacterium]